MTNEIKSYSESMEPVEREICQELSKQISRYLPDAENKIWHGHPVWFIEGNPIVGYSRLKAGIRLMFWSGAGFDEETLKPGTGKFKDASILFKTPDEVNEKDLKRWLKKSESIQWDYKNVVKRKGRLERLK